jgi:hypothetical protein
MSPNLTGFHKMSQKVTKCHKTSQNVTKCHKMSQNVTLFFKVSFLSKWDTTYSKCKVKIQAVTSLAGHLKLLIKMPFLNYNFTESFFMI